MIVLIVKNTGNVVWTSVHGNVAPIARKA